MGYTTDFSGSFRIEPELPNVIAQYIQAFNDSRRMKRRDLPVHGASVFNRDGKGEKFDFVLGAEALPVRQVIDKFLVGGGYGTEGEFFVDGIGMAGQGRDSTVVDSNSPASTQPGLWCQWTIKNEGELAWDEGEKFYDYAEWLRYLIANVFKPNGHTLNGEVTWIGEDRSDVGTLEVVGNVLYVHEGAINYKPKPKTKTVECYHCGERIDVECE